MKKMKKLLTIFVGSVMTFYFKLLANAQVFPGPLEPEATWYGSDYYEPEPQIANSVTDSVSDPNLWGKILAIIITPIFLATFFIVAIFLGTITYLKKRKK